MARVIYPIPILTLMLNKWYCLNIFNTIQGKGQAQALRVRFPTFPYLLTTKQNKHEAARQRINNVLYWNYCIYYPIRTN